MVRCEFKWLHVAASNSPTAAATTPRSDEGVWVLRSRARAPGRTWGLESSGKCVGQICSNVDASKINICNSVPMLNPYCYTPGRKPWSWFHGNGKRNRTLQGQFEFGGVM